MKSPNFTRAQLEAMLAEQRRRTAAHMAQLSHELFVLATVLAGPCRGGPDAVQRWYRNRQRINVALLEQNGLIDADGKPPGWTVEQDRAEEALALSDLTTMRKVS